MSPMKTLPSTRRGSKNGIGRRSPSPSHRILARRAPDTGSNVPPASDPLCVRSNVPSTRTPMDQTAGARTTEPWIGMSRSRGMDEVVLDLMRQ